MIASHHLEERYAGQREGVGGLLLLLPFHSKTALFSRANEATPNSVKAATSVRGSRESDIFRLDVEDQIRLPIINLRLLTKNASWMDGWESLTYTSPRSSTHPFRDLVSGTLSR
jgi:hypothetical protein